MSYFRNNNKQYLVSYSLTPEVDLRLLHLSELSNKVKVSESISIIVVIEVEEDYFDYSMIRYQLESNDIWYYAVKRSGLTELLKSIKTKYTLVLNCPDAMITEDLTEDFLNTFKTLNEKFVFTAVNVQSTDQDFTNGYKYLSSATYKFPDKSVCFGETSFIISFYSELDDILKANEYLIKQEKLTHSGVEQLCTEAFLDGRYALDSESKLFTSYINSENYILEINNQKYIESNDNIIYKGALI